MKKENMAYAQKLGWFFIVLSLLSIISVVRGISYWLRFIDLILQSPELAGGVLAIFFTGLVLGGILILAYFFAGIGMVRLKIWAYDLALVIPFLTLMSTLTTVWLFGIQLIMKPDFFVSATIIVLFFIPLLRKQVIQTFSEDYLARKGKALDPLAHRNALLRRYCIVFGSIIVFVLCVWFAIVHTTFRDTLPLMKIRPQQVEYQIQDHDFIVYECDKREIFDYSLFVPRELKIGSVRMSDFSARDDSSLSIFFLQEHNSEISFMMFESYNYSESLLFLIAKAFNFRNTYDFEKKIIYPNWTPIYFTLKAVLTPGGLVSIDEVRMPSWKGFVNIIKRKNSGANGYIGSVYSILSDKTCGFFIGSHEHIFTPQQVESILASLEFKVSDQDSASLFVKGQQALSQKDHTTATIHFMNAFYRDQRNMQYAYYLARSLYEDSADQGRSGRLKSAKDFLEFVLKREPENSQAQALLAVVIREIESEEAKKMDEAKRQEER